MAKKSSRKPHKKEQSRRSRALKADKQEVNPVATSEPVAQDNIAVAASVAADEVRTEDEAPVATIAIAPIESEQPNDPVMDGSADAKPQTRMWPAASLLAVVAVLVLAVGLYASFLRPASKEPTSSAVSNIESALDGDLTTTQQNCLDNTAQQPSLGAQTAGQQLQSVPVNDIQSPQLVENQVGKNGGVQMLQPAGCF